MFLKNDSRLFSGPVSEGRKSVGVLVDALWASGRGVFPESSVNPRAAVVFEQVPNFHEETIMTSRKGDARRVLLDGVIFQEGEQII